MVIHKGCGGDVTSTFVEVGGYRISASECTRCGQSIVDAALAQLVLAHNNLARRGEPLVGTITTVGGTSVALRLPAELARGYGLQAGAQVELRPTRPGAIEVVLAPEAEQIVAGGGTAPVRRHKEPSPDAAKKSVDVLTKRSAFANTTTAHIEPDWPVLGVSQ